MNPKVNQYITEMHFLQSLFFFVSTGCCCPVSTVLFYVFILVWDTIRLCRTLYVDYYHPSVNQEVGLCSAGVLNGVQIVE